MPQIGIPFVKRLGDGFNFRNRITRHRLAWLVVFLVPISGISLFFMTKQPMTADVPSTKQIEIRAERDLGPRPVEEIDIVSPVMSKEAMASKPEELPQKTVDDTAAKQTSISHLVQTGDTLTSIARKYKTSVDAIISENNLPNHTINIGQTLKISISGGVASNSKGG